MAQDSDPNVGVGVIIGGSQPIAGLGPSIASKLCVSFERSLHVLNIDNIAGAYGLDHSGLPCHKPWKLYQRDGWLQKLVIAETEVKRDLGKSICPEEIVGELHDIHKTIHLNQAPISYLGQKTYGDWTEVDLIWDGDEAYFALCESDLDADMTDDNVQFSYPDEVLSCFTGLQSLQAPCVSEAAGCGIEDGWRFTWPSYQLVRPDVESAAPSEYAEDTIFVHRIKWRTWTIDSTSGGELVGICDCDCCSSDQPVTLSIADAYEGVICVDGCDTGLDTCYCRNRKIRINYATAYGSGYGIDRSVEEAVVLLALVKTGMTPVKPCGCDNRWTDWMLEDDPTSRTEFASKLKYGSTRAGMEVWRKLMNIKEKPHFNEPGVESGGLLTKRKMRNKNRTRSVLRGF